MGDTGAYMAKGMYRNRRLLNAAHELSTCTNCGRHSTEGLEPAHSNLIEHGRGKDNPAHDCFFAALCHACHAWLDHGSAAMDPSGLYDCTKEDKREMFVRAMHRTWYALWSRLMVRMA